MFSLIKQGFSVLLGFSISLARDKTKYLFLNDEPWMVRPTLIDLNPVEIKCYLFLIYSDKCTGSCNVLSPKICVPKETKDRNAKAFDMTKNKNEAKVMTKYIPCDCECKFNSTACYSNEKWNNKTCQCEYKKDRTCKKDSSWNPDTCICEDSKNLKVLLILQ